MQGQYKVTYPDVTSAVSKLCKDTAEGGLDFNFKIEWVANLA